MYNYVCLISGGDLNTFDEMGFLPVGSVKGNPTLLKRLSPGRHIGYGCTYETKDSEGEWIATIPFGYADGYFRSLSNRGYVVRDSTGKLHLYGIFQGLF